MLACNPIDKLDYTIGSEIEYVQGTDCESLSEQFSQLDWTDEGNLYLLALQEAKCGDIELAMEYLEQSIALNSSDVFKHYSLAEILLYNSDPSGAYNEIVKAELELPTNYYVLILKAEIQYYGGLNEPSLSTLKFIEKRDTTKSDIYRIRYMIYRSENDFEKSYESIKTAIKKEPENPYLYYYAADILELVKKYEEAIPYLDKCIELDNSESDYYLKRGLSYYFSGNTEYAESDWDTCVVMGNAKAQEYLDKYID